LDEFVVVVFVVACCCKSGEQCRRPCYNGGTCTSSGRCHCRAGYYGRRCQIGSYVNSLSPNTLQLIKFGLTNWRINLYSVDWT